MKTHHFIHLLVMAVISACSVKQQPSNIDAALQNATDSIMLGFISRTPAESVYCITLDQDSRVLAWFSWTERHGRHPKTYDKEEYYIIPGTLLLPALLESAIVDGVWTPASDNDSSVIESLALSNRDLISKLAYEYHYKSEHFEKHRKDWFPHAFSLIPVNAPEEVRDRYTQQVFGGETMMVPAAEIAAFYSAAANGGTMITPRRHPRDAIRKTRILSESLADRLSELLQQSTSYVGDFPFPVSGKEGTMIMNAEQNGPLFTSFVGTYDTTCFGPLTTLVVIRFTPTSDYNTRTVFKSLAVAFRNIE